MAVPLNPAYTESQAVTIAEGYDLIVANAKQLSATTIAAMKAANPTVRILVYLNGSFRSGHVQQYPLSEYARDANGDFITSVKYHNWLMDVGNPAWADQVSQECTTALSSSHGMDVSSTCSVTPCSKTAISAVSRSTRRRTAVDGATECRNDCDRERRHRGTPEQHHHGQWAQRRSQLLQLSRAIFRIAGWRERRTR